MCRAGNARTGLGTPRCAVRYLLAREGPSGQWKPVCLSRPSVSEDTIEFSFVVVVILVAVNVHLSSSHAYGVLIHVSFDIKFGPFGFVHIFHDYLSSKRSSNYLSTFLLFHFPVKEF